MLAVESRLEWRAREKLRTGTLEEMQAAMRVWTQLCQPSTTPRCEGSDDLDEESCVAMSCDANIPLEDTEVDGTESVCLEDTEVVEAHGGDAVVVRQAPANLEEIDSDDDTSLAPMESPILHHRNVLACKAMRYRKCSDDENIAEAERIEMAQIANTVARCEMALVERSLEALPLPPLASKVINGDEIAVAQVKPKQLQSLVVEPLVEKKVRPLRSLSVEDEPSRPSFQVRERSQSAPEAKSTAEKDPERSLLWKAREQVLLHRALRHARRGNWSLAAPLLLKCADSATCCLWLSVVWLSTGQPKRAMDALLQLHHPLAKPLLAVTHGQLNNWTGVREAIVEGAEDIGEACHRVSRELDARDELSALVRTLLSPLPQCWEKQNAKSSPVHAPTPRFAACVLVVFLSIVLVVIQ